MIGAAATVQRRVRSLPPPTTGERAASGRKRWGAESKREVRSRSLGELRLGHHAFIRFGGALDAVEVLAALDREQPNDGAGALASRKTHASGHEVDGLADFELVRLMQTLIH